MDILTGTPVNPVELGKISNGNTNMDPRKEGPETETLRLGTGDKVEALIGMGVLTKNTFEIFFKQSILPIIQQAIGASRQDKYSCTIPKKVLAELAQKIQGKQISRFDFIEYLYRELHRLGIDFIDMRSDDGFTFLKNTFGIGRKYINLGEDGYIISFSSPR